MITRRQFIAAASAASLPATGFAYPSIDYAPATWEDVKARTDRFVLNWRASWSMTCQIKHDLLTGLVSSEPAYRNLTFVDVDWDVFGPSIWAQRLKVERRSTLIAFDGDREIARVVNEPYEYRLRDFLDTALTA